jgi:hypothetical protein
MNGKQIYNPGLIFLLKERTDKKSKDLIREGASLKMDITALEKERRHMHTLLCDLIYFLEEDSKHNTNRINAIVSTSMTSAYPEELDLCENSTDRQMPPKSALKKPTVNNKINLGISCVLH